MSVNRIWKYSLLPWVQCWCHCEVSANSASGLWKFRRITCWQWVSKWLFWAWLTWPPIPTPGAMPSTCCIICPLYPSLTDDAFWCTVNRMGMSGELRVAKIVVSNPPYLTLALPFWGKKTCELPPCLAVLCGERDAENSEVVSLSLDTGKDLLSHGKYLPVCCLMSTVFDDYHKRKYGCSCILRWTIVFCILCQCVVFKNVLVT